MGWLLSLPFWGATSPIVRKFIVYGVVSLVILYAFKVWLNSHDDKVYQEGKIGAISQMEKDKKKEWEDIQAKLDQQKKALDTEAKTIDQAKKQLGLQQEDVAKLRRIMNDNLFKALTVAKSGRDTGNEKANLVPADMLDSALRAKSAELAATEPAAIK